MWTKLEPVRTYLYSLLTPLVALLVADGVLTNDNAVLWIAVAAAVLGVPVVETVRSRVTPVDSGPNANENH